METARLSRKSPTIRRILREAQELSNSPSADYTAAPLESDLFEWHFTFRGPPNSVYSEGIYHGKIVLPSTYPLRPPSFRFATPSGRFEANREICLSISGHHEETWQPAWGVRTALVALRSFMETSPNGQLGGLDTPDDVRRRFASESRSFRCASCGKTNLEIMTECDERVAAAAKEESSSAVTDEVPPELTMEWKDKMEVPVKDATESTQPKNDVPRPAEDTTNHSTIQSNTGAPAPLPGPELRERSGATAQASTRGHQPPPQNPPAIANPHHIAPHSEDGVPLWVDRAIVILVVLLALLIFKLAVGR